VCPVPGTTASTTVAPRLRRCLATPPQYSTLVAPFHHASQLFYLFFINKNNFIFYFLKKI
jgi:hypothetical protein